MCSIKAGTTLETLRKSPVMHALFPHFENDMRMICTAPIRERATIGGNLANASPIADMAVFLLALAAKLHLCSLNGETRSIALQDFFKAYKQVHLQANERIVEISFPCPQQPLPFSFEKISKRQYGDIASVNSGLFLEMAHDNIKTVHFSAGGVAPVPLYLQKTCAYLQGKTVGGAVIRHAIAIAQTEISPISDLRGSIQYKRLLLRQITIAHSLKLLPNLLSAEDLL